MKNSIFGFNQLKVIEFNNDHDCKIDLVDLLILEYIASSFSFTNMEYTVVDGDAYVWVSHKKLLEELPIIGIKENMLRKRIHKLCELNLIESNKVSDCEQRGSKTYYKLTEISKCFYSDDVTTTCNELQTLSRPHVKNYTSDNYIYNTINNSINSNSNITITTKRTRKKSLYESCIDIINSFTGNNQIQELLIQYLNVLLEIYRSNGKQLYKNVFKGKLNTLKKIIDENNYSDEDTEEVIRNSINNGWQNFYILRRNDRSEDNIRWDKDVCAGGEIIYEEY